MQYVLIIKSCLFVVYFSVYAFLAERFVCITVIAFMLKIKLYQNFSFDSCREFLPLYSHQFSLSP